MSQQIFIDSQLQIWCFCLEPLKNTITDWTKSFTSILILYTLDMAAPPADSIDLMME